MRERERERESKGEMVMNVGNSEFRHFWMFFNSISFLFFFGDY